MPSGEKLNLSLQLSTFEHLRIFGVSKSFLWKCLVWIHGRQKDFFQREPLGDFTKIFLREKVVIFAFPIGNQENNLPLLKFSKSREALAPLPNTHIWVLASS